MRGRRLSQHVAESLLFCCCLVHLHDGRRLEELRAVTPGKDLAILDSISKPVR